jgi:hypothetical protein
MPPASPAGPMTSLCGPGAALASRSRSRAKDSAPQTSVTSGPSGSVSLRTADLQRFLASRLARRLARVGSTEWLLTWKTAATPSGRPFCRLVPSTRPTDGIGCGLWPTPAARDWRSESASPEFLEAWAANPKGKTLPMMLQLATWPTPTCPSKHDSQHSAGRPRPHRRGWLADEVGHSLGVWPTPTASLADKGVRSTEGAMREAARSHGPDLAAVAGAAALWPTPVANDDNKSPEAHMAMKARMKGGPRNCITSLQVMAKANGPAQPGSSATTEKPGALNPEFVCWLMGFPPAWVSCGVSAMQSIRDQRRRSSRPLSKQ